MNDITSFVLYCLGLLFSLSSFVLCFSQKTLSEEVHFNSKLSPGHSLNCLIYKPKNFKPTTIYPLLVFLHGSGAAGNNLSRLKLDGLPRLIEEGQGFPFVVIAPQLPAALNNAWDPEFVKEFIVYALAHYPVDANRVCLTGFSMGSTGVWDYACQFPSTISSAVPLSGWGDPQVVCRMRSTPTWVFHGVMDKIVNIGGSRNMTNSLRNCGG